MEARLAGLARLIGANPVKNLLSFYAERRGLSPLHLYKRALQDCLCLETSLQTVSILADNNARRFYGPPSQEPQYLSIRRHASLVRLSQVLKEQFVVLQVFEGRRDPLKIFDLRTNRVVLSGQVSQEGEVFCILYDRPSDSYKVYHLTSGDPGDICFGGLDVTEQTFMRDANFDLETPCFLTRLSRLLGVELTPPLEESGESVEPWSLLDVCCKSDVAFRRLRGINVLLVYHLGTLPVKAGRTNLENRLRPERQTFRIVGMVRGSAQTEGRLDWEAVRVVSVTSTGRLYLVQERYADKLLKEKMVYAKDPVLGGPLSSLPRDVRRRLSESSSSSSSDGEELQVAATAAVTAGHEVGAGEESVRKRKKKKKKKKSKKRKGDLVDEISPCSCQTCKEGWKYKYNLGPTGPQFLYRIQFCPQFYLEMFNLDTPENREALAYCTRLSCVSMDIESVTVDLDPDLEEESRSSTPPDSPPFDAPRRRRVISSSSDEEGVEPSSGGEGSNASAAASSSSDTEESDPEGDEEEEGIASAGGAPFKHLSSAPRSDPLSEDPTALQRPILIGHLDNLEPRTPRYFEVKGGLEGVQVAVDEYLTHLMVVREHTSHLKEKRLAPLLEFCASYQRTHQSFFDERQVEDKVTRGVWQRTHLGLFQKELRRLISNLYIFSFNGSGEAPSHLPGASVGSA